MTPLEKNKISSLIGQTIENICSNNDRFIVTLSSGDKIEFSGESTFTQSGRAILTFDDGTEITADD